MQRSIKVLHLEDNPHGAELVREIFPRPSPRSAFVLPAARPSANGRNHSLPQRVRAWGESTYRRILGLKPSLFSAPAPPGGGGP